MKGYVRTWRLPLLLILAAALNMGCGLDSLYFLLPHQDDKQPAELLKIAPEKPNQRDVHVVLLASSPSDTPPEFINVDRDLCSILARHMQQAFKENKEHVVIVPPHQIDKFKDEHTDWRTLDLDVIGKHFHADYVIYFDIESIELYEKGSAHTLFRGRTAINVSVLNMRKSADEYPVSRHYATVYPPETEGAVSVDDRGAAEFKETFFDFVTKHLTWYFTEHSTETEFHAEIPEH